MFLEHFFLGFKSLDWLLIILMLYNCLQFHYAVFFAYMRLGEQEVRNLMWISECVAQQQKSRIHDGVVMIF